MAKSAQPTMARSLKNRHIQLMAIGGTIGTGLFLGAGQSIHLAGPSLLLAYAIMGGVCFFIMRALGELLVSDVDKPSFIDFIKQYLGSDWGFVTGWTYWICWLAIAMAEVTAIGVYIHYWLPGLPQWLPGLVALVILLLMNLISVGVFGETEFWFALIKVAAILALIAVGIWMLIMSYPTPAGHASLRNLVAYGGFFPHGARGFFLSFQMVTFSFAAIEMVGLTAGEASDPETVIPKAIDELPMRIILFYIGALTVIMAIYPWNTVHANSSPFVQVFANLGIGYAADVVNFVVITAAASSCNSALFSTGRLLFSLSLTSTSPRVRRLAKLSRRQVPARATLVSAVIVAGAVVLNLVLPSAVFTLISSVATTSFLFIWSMIVLAHLRYRRAHPGGGRFPAPWFPWGDYVVLAFLAAVFVIMLFTTTTAVSAGVAILWVAVLYGARRWWRKTN